jgi:hypothetical protein
MTVNESSIKYICIVAIFWIIATHPRILDSFDKISSKLKTIDIQQVEFHIDCVVCFKK